MTDTAVLEALYQYKQQAMACALVIVVDSRGSVPAGPGAKMLVAEDGHTVGTVGGGAMEQEAGKKARDLIRRGGGPELIHMDLTRSSGHVCGGQVSLYMEPVLPAPRLIVCGAGHVGQAVCRLGAYAGFSVTAADDRQDILSPENLPDVHQVKACAFEELFCQIPVDTDTFVVVCTRGHAHDYTVVENALKTPARYIGLLGSKSKKAAFFEKLRTAGFSDADLNRIYTPAGLDIGAKTPQEIGFSIVGQLISQRRQNACKNRGHRAGCGRLGPDGPDQTASPCAG
ncbi:MAG: XdhC family protein [Desulfobacterales bacterium]|nr:XdhC family protein [Desulfobacterales bacterium]